jgi:hypothetical protein
MPQNQELSRLNPNERAEFYKVLPNDITIKIATIHSNEYLNHFIDNDLALTPDITPDKVDAIIGLIFNIQTNALSKICYFKEIEEEVIEDEAKVKSVEMNI